MKILNAIAGLFAMGLGASAICLAVAIQRFFSSSAIILWGDWHDYAFVGVLATLGVGLLVAGYDFAFRTPPRKS